MYTIMRISFGIAAFLLGSATVSAQWQNVTYTLNGGWNAIYLHGEATQAAPEVLFASGDAAQVEEIWRWNPNPNEVQFTETPLIISPGTPEWSVWIRGGSSNTLSGLAGQAAYLVRCSGTKTDSYAVTILQKPLPPRATWIRRGANLLGFPTYGDAAFNPVRYPVFSDYFRTFPAAIAANTRIFQYVGGALGPLNPVQLFTPANERLVRNRAYWFSSRVVGDFYAPIEIDLTARDGIAFGRTGSAVTARLRNRTDAVVTVTFDPVVSDAAPAGETVITAAVPLTRRSFNTASGTWDEIPVTGSFSETIAPQGGLEVHFGVDRGAMAASAPALYASLVKITDGGNLMEVTLPATAEKATLAGLWAGDITVTTVDSRVAEDGRALAEVQVNGSGEVTGITVTDGGFGYDLTPTITVATTAGLTAGMPVNGSGLSGEARVTRIIGNSRLKISEALPEGTVALLYGGTMLSTTSTGTAVVTVPATAGLTAGMAVGGPGIAGTATVSSVTNATTLVLSQSVATGVNDLWYGGILLTSRIIATPPPTVVIAAPPGSGGSQATAAAILADGEVTGFSVIEGGSGYSIPPARGPEVTVTAPVGGAVPRPYPLRALLHVNDNGGANLLSTVFMGRLADAGNPTGICTRESGLDASEKGNALRFSVAHLPLDLVLGEGSPGSSGEVALGASLVRSIVVPYNDPTNPFVHQYHPDHDNRDARPDGTNIPKGNGDESYTITRTCSFNFTASPPEGVSSVGWGSTVIGGTYAETFDGLHRDALVVSGTFVLRRVSEIGILTINN